MLRQFDLGNAAGYRRRYSFNGKETIEAPRGEQKTEDITQRVKQPGRGLKHVPEGSEQYETIDEHNLNSPSES
jgi:hypothetical protein